MATLPVLIIGGVAVYAVMHYWKSQSNAYLAENPEAAQSSDINNSASNLLLRCQNGDRSACDQFQNLNQGDVSLEPSAIEPDRIAYGYDGTNP